MTNRLIHGDCLNTPLLPNYFDTLITDSPYGLGFMGKEWDNGVPGTRFWKKFLDACKPGAFAFVFGGTRTYHRLACAIEDAGWEIRDCMMWLYGSGFPKSLDIGKAIDKAKGAGREKIAEGTSGKTRQVLNAALYPESFGGNYDITVPTTDLAKQWDGYGTALKPAWEPIIVAMKPLDGTFAHNAEKWGVGGLWIDGGRIGTERVKTCGEDKFKGQGIYGKYNTCIESTHEGRWPANVILDEEAGAMLDEQSGQTSITGKRSQRSQVASVANTQWLSDNHKSKEYPNDFGGASRFFYCAKASKKERNDGLDDLPDKQMYKCDGSGQSLEIFGTTDGGRAPRKNNHPTVKPLALMEYLCKLSRPPQGGIVLDPFAGSGTTALACVNTDRQYIVIEKEREYCEIIAARLGGIPIETTIPQRPRLYNA